MKNKIIGLVLSLILIAGLVSSTSAQVSPSMIPCWIWGEQGVEITYTNSWPAYDATTGRSYMVTVTDYYDNCTGQSWTTIERVPM